jgi:hypothetical protein
MMSQVPLMLLIVLLAGCSTSLPSGEAVLLEPVHTAHGSVEGYGSVEPFLTNASVTGVMDLRLHLWAAGFGGGEFIAVRIDVQAEPPVGIDGNPTPGLFRLRQGWWHDIHYQVGPFAQPGKVWVGMRFEAEPGNPSWIAWRIDLEPGREPRARLLPPCDSNDTRCFAMPAYDDPA